MVFFITLVIERKVTEYFIYSLSVDVLIARVSLYGKLISSKKYCNVNLNDLKSLGFFFFFVLLFVCILCVIRSPKSIMLLKAQTSGLLTVELFGFWLLKIIYEGNHCILKMIVFLSCFVLSARGNVS